MTAYIDIPLIGILVLSSAFLFYIYGGYRYLLKSIVFFKRKSIRKHLSFDENDFTPGLTVFFSALNEEKKIRRRIINILDQDYPLDELEIIVVSDGSTDKTVECVNSAIEEFPDATIRLLEFKENRGQAAAQNAVAHSAVHDILVSTDAETFFTDNFLREIVKPFQDPRIGAVGAVTRFVSEGAILGESYKLYRNMEYEIRGLETALGICVKTDGACTAYLRSVWKNISDYEDVDHVIAIFSRKNNRIIVQAERAICLDKPNTRRTQEIKARARMTRKTLLSTFSRWKLRDIIKYPTFSFALYSHRIFRVFSPVFLLLLIISLFLASYRINLFMEFLILFCSGTAVLFINQSIKIPLIHNQLNHLVHFIYANIGFSIGIVDWINGNQEGRYNPTRHE